MKKIHLKNTTRYYIVVVLVFFFLFLSGDFGLVDVQKTAIVMAVGIDREDDTIILTSQIAVPQASKQGDATQTVQLVSRGKTVADAFDEINAKTGWYPKLVFCHLLILGEKTTEQNVFEALDFFLLDEYMPDNCLVATCEGVAKDLLNVTALVDPSGSLAIQKVLSQHAQRVGTAMPSTLREFAIGYFSDAKSGFLPVVKTQPQQEKIQGENGQAGQGGQGEQGGGQSSSSGGGGQGGQSSGQNGSSGGSSGSGGQGGQKSQSGNGETDKPVFSASETALFVGGIKKGVFTEEETFAYNAVKNDLKLASYTVKTEENFCSLTVKNNDSKIKLHYRDGGRAHLKIDVVMSAGLLDYSGSLSLENVTDGGDVPSGAFTSAEKLLSSQIVTAFEKCRLCACDLFGVGERMQKYKPRAYKEYKDSLLQNATYEIHVKFRNIR